jgi:hypothetical protein
MMRTLKSVLWWEIAGGLLIGVIVGVLAGARLIGSNQYQALGLHNAALYCFQSSLNRTMIPIVLTTGIVCGITALCVTLRRPRTAALLVGFLPAAYIVLKIGYELNRYDFKEYWLSPRYFLGLPLRAGFFEPAVILANVGVVALALGACWAGYKLTVIFIRKTSSMTHRVRQPFRPYWLIMAVILVMVGFNIFCRLHRSRNRAQGPNVVLISLDTLRADHLGCYGYHRDTSPRIDQLALRSVVFEKAVTQSAWTLPSHKSVLTSLLPPALRSGVDQITSLDPRHVTLAETLLDTGYQTVAFAHGLGWVTPRFGFEQGFQRYSVPAERLIPTRAAAEMITELAISWLDRRGKGSFFMFLHYADPHSDSGLLPYEVPEPYGTMFAKEVGGRFVGAEGHPGGSLYLRDISMGYVSPAPQEIDYIEALYDGGIRYTDRYIGLLVDALDTRGILNNTILIITSDHGEEFMEHGKMLHGRVYRETVHVPLIIRFPEAAWRGMRISTQVRLIDVVPTVLDYLGLAIGDRVHGESLLPLAHEGGLARPAFTEGGNSYALRADGWVLMTDLSLGGRELYNLTEDPGETRDVAGAFPQREQMLAGMLSDLVSAAKGSRPGGSGGRHGWTDARTRETLKTLGYIDRGDP